MRKTILALLLGLAALSAAACGNSSGTTAPGGSTESLTPVQTAAPSTSTESAAPSTEASPASS